MAGLTGHGWSTPENCDGDKEDGTPGLVPGLSILYYAGGGRPTTFHMPPRQPNRDVSLPAAWVHLAKQV